MEHRFSLHFYYSWRFMLTYFLRISQLRIEDLRIADKVGGLHLSISVRLAAFVFQEVQVGKTV